MDCSFDRLEIKRVQISSNVEKLYTTSRRPFRTSGLKVLTKGRIAVLSPLTAVNGFVRP